MTHEDMLTRLDAISTERYPLLTDLDMDALKMAVSLLDQELSKNDLGVDCISRAEVMQVLQEHWLNGTVAHRIIAEIGNDIQHLPSVTPQERTGHWVKTPKAVMGDGYMWYCDKCEYQVYQDSSRPYPSEKYCPNCGSDNRKVEV